MGKRQYEREALLEGQVDRLRGVVQEQRRQISHQEAEASRLSLLCKGGTEDNCLEVSACRRCHLSRDGLQVLLEALRRVFSVIRDQARATKAHSARARWK